MKYQPLGHSSLHVSQVAFGCMSLQPGAKESVTLLRDALDQGITFFDTADLYDKGSNEELVGTALAGRRNDCVIATKVGNQWRNDGSGWDWNPQKKYILSAVENSLRRLQTDFIDLYQLHGGTLEDPIPDIIEAFELLKQQGKIRYYGISSIRPNVIREWIRQGACTSVMMQYSLLDRRPEESCLELLQNAGIGVLARGALAKGLLAGKKAAAYLNYTATQVAAMSAKVDSLRTTDELSSSVALQYVLQNPAVTSAVVGIRTTAQLQEAIAAAKRQPLSDEAITLLQTTLPPSYYSEHR